MREGLGIYNLRRGKYGRNGFELIVIGGVEVSEFEDEIFFF